MHPDSPKIRINRNNRDPRVEAGDLFMRYYSLQEMYDSAVIPI